MRVLSWGVAIFGFCVLALALSLGWLRRTESAALWLAYVTDPNGVSQIFVMDFYGEHVRPLTNGVGDDLSPAWSPANNYVAFAAFRGQASAIYLIPPRGGTLIEIALAIGSAINPTWSPNGDYLVFERFTNRGDRSLIGYDLQTQDLQLLTTPAQLDWYPIWSRQADTLLYLSSTSVANNQLMRLNVRQAQPQPLTTIARNYSHPTWSPDGRWVAYESSDGDLWLLDLVTGEDQPLLLSIERETMPIWSPNGAWIAFLRDEADGTRQVYRINTSGGALLRLSDPQMVRQAVGAVRWSDGGTWLAYVALGHGTSTTAIYRVGVNGQQHARLTDHAYNSSSPTWSPTLDDGALHVVWLMLVGGTCCVLGIKIIFGEDIK